MAIQHALWKIGQTPTALAQCMLANEQQLEEMIVAAPEIVSAQWMLIGRQEQTGMGGRIDLLAIAPDASLVLIELKRNRTPREIVASDRLRVVGRKAHRRSYQPDLSPVLQRRQP